MFADLPVWRPALRGLMGNRIKSEQLRAAPAAKVCGEIKIRSKTLSSHKVDLDC